MTATLTLPRHLNYDAVLTAREDEITGVLAMGKSRKEVPDLIRPTKKGKPIAVATVRQISKSIYVKTGAQKAPELTIWWFVRKYSIPIGILFLLLILSSEFAPIPTALRSRTKMVEYRSGRLKRRGEENSSDFIFEA